MSAQLDSTEISSHESLDHALIQCLRLFAQRGRKLRKQEMQPMELVSDNGLVVEQTEDLHDTENC
jgi:hypothetical protein